MSDSQFMALTNELIVELELHAQAWVAERWSHLAPREREAMLDRVWGAIIVRESARLYDTHRLPVTKRSLAHAISVLPEPLLAEAENVLRARGAT